MYHQPIVIASHWSCLGILVMYAYGQEIGGYVLLECFYFISKKLDVLPQQHPLEQPQFLMAPCTGLQPARWDRLWSSFPPAGLVSVQRQVTDTGTLLKRVVFWWCEFLRGQGGQMEVYI